MLFLGSSNYNELLVLNFIHRQVKLTSYMSQFELIYPLLKTTNENLY